MKKYVDFNRAVPKGKHHLVCMHACMHASMAGVTFSVRLEMQN